MIANVKVTCHNEGFVDVDFMVTKEVDSRLVVVRVNIKDVRILVVDG